MTHFNKQINNSFNVKSRRPSSAKVPHLTINDGTKTTHDSDSGQKSVEDRIENGRGLFPLGRKRFLCRLASRGDVGRLYTPLPSPSDSSFKSVSSPSVVEISLGKFLCTLNIECFGI